MKKEGADEWGCTIGLNCGLDRYYMYFNIIRGVYTNNGLI